MAAIGTGPRHGASQRCHEGKDGSSGHQTLFQRVWQVWCAMLGLGQAPCSQRLAFSPPLSATGTLPCYDHKFLVYYYTILGTTGTLPYVYWFPLHGSTDTLPYLHWFLHGSTGTMPLYVFILSRMHDFHMCVIFNECSSLHCLNLIYFCIDPE